MQSRRTTIMILAPGRDAISLDLDVWRRRVLPLLCMPLLLGFATQRSFGAGADKELPAVAMASLQRAAEVNQPVVQPPAKPQPAALRTLMTAVRPAEVPLKAGLTPVAAAGGSMPELSAGNTISVKSILKAISERRKATSEVEPNAVPINGVLRLQALHLGETICTRPFDDLLRPDAKAFSDINHLMRCRVTGHEIDMDPRLIGILVQLSSIYGRTLQLISGHRVPGTVRTSDTSQHTLGRAADIRIPGVSINELKKVAIKLGARGVGLYPEKGFVHVDVREKRYYWVWTARGGEQADMGFTPRRAAKAAAAASDDEDGEQSEGEAVDAHEHDAQEHETAAPPEPSGESQ
ncbi:MAG TPA: DUF882 domain-containing protein [Polyangiales bacterium]|nr:DUF882 domain-containing protein [Polyangiales bacterium]